MPKLPWASIISYVDWVGFRAMPFPSKLIFTVTPGRSGTQYLTHLLEHVPGVTATHEPEPNFASILRRSKIYPEKAFAFLRDMKLPEIAKCETPIYAETSHVICKGFIEPMIIMGLRPSLICLRRPPREVAWSHYHRNSVPMRSENGTHFLLAPTDPFVLPFYEHESASDYQMCFWYALEMERRMFHYRVMAMQLGLEWTEITNLELNDFEKFCKMLRDLNIAFEPDAAFRAMHAEVSAQSHNMNPSKHEFLEELIAQEEAVWQRVSYFDPLLRHQISKAYGFEV